MYMYIRSHVGSSHARRSPVSHLSSGCRSMRGAFSVLAHLQRIHQPVTRTMGSVSRLWPSSSHGSASW